MDTSSIPGFYVEALPPDVTLPCGADGCGKSARWGLYQVNQRHASGQRHLLLRAGSSYTRVRCDSDLASSLTTLTAARGADLVAGLTNERRQLSKRFAEVRQYGGRSAHLIPITSRKSSSLCGIDPVNRFAPCEPGTLPLCKVCQRRGLQELT